jgi:hypothetical protein
MKSPAPNPKSLCLFEICTPTTMLSYFFSLKSETGPSSGFAFEV